MSTLLSILFALQLGLGLGFFGYSVLVTNGQEISQTRLAEGSCPLNFDILRKLVKEGTRRRSFLDVSSQCKKILEGFRLVRSEYLRTNGYFLPPPAAAVACLDSYRDFMREFVVGFDIISACGYHPEWISESCMNITSQWQFESLIPKPKLQEVRRLCDQSLQDNSRCSLCKEILSSVGASYLHGPPMGNASDCTGYPFMYAAALVNQFGPTDRVTAKCLFSLDFPLRNSRIRQHIVVICGIVIGCAIGFFGAFVVVWLLFMMHKKSTREKNIFSKIETSLDLELRSVGENFNSYFIKFKLDEVKRATQNFSRENIVGKGGYGNVYKGLLSDGSAVALKRFKNCSAFGDAAFAHEVEVIASVRHANLVALRGYCTEIVPMEGHQRIIVCDLMHNGNLYDNLFGALVKKLSWPIRQKIALGTANGLAYLHYGVNPAIIHRDVKSSNILLDENFEPKLADFGFAKFTSEGKTHLTTRVAGTLGYVAPEYALYGQLTERSDVYSFGIVLLELLSGKKALISTNEGQNSLLTDWAWSLVKEGRAVDVLEAGMPELGLPEVMEQYVLIAVLCSHPILQARPTMDQVVKMLETEFAVPSVC